MLSVEVPENDQANARQMELEANKSKRFPPEDSMEELHRKAHVVIEAHKHMANPDTMRKIQPIIDKHIKALKGLSGLKKKINDKHLREMQKGQQSTD